MMTYVMPAWGSVQTKSSTFAALTLFSFWLRSQKGEHDSQKEKTKQKRSIIAAGCGYPGDEKAEAGAGRFAIEVEPVRWLFRRKRISAP